MDTPRPPVRGRYSIRSPFANFLFHCLDGLLALAVRPSSRRRQAAPPQRILISNIAHLGDVIMATAMLPVLKQAYPEAQIGFLAGSWSRSILQGHPLVDSVHVLDHWAHNRAGVSKLKKLLQYLRTRRTALREIRAARYDAAFDLYWNFPNTLPLLWQAKVPVRVGYESGGFGPLATQALEFGDKRLHAAQRFLDLIKVLPGVEADPAALLPVLASANQQEPGAAGIEPNVETEPALAAELRAAGLHGKDYIVFHVGAADRFRNWPVPQWRELAQLFIAEGNVLVFTGTGARDEAQVQEITEGLSGCVNWCSCLEWPSFVAALAQARLLVCVDTVAGHIAAATKTPCVVITAGRWPYLWRPLGQNTQVLLHPTPCTPCHRNNGCEGMECLRLVTVASVYQKALALSASPH